MSSFYLPTGLPIPTSDAQGLTAPFWQGLREEKLKIQRCASCGAWQWGPEWLCHACHSFEVEWVETEPKGRMYSWERVWQPPNSTMKAAVPYLVVLIELDVGTGVRLIGNLLGSPEQNVEIGSAVRGVFEHHHASEPPFTLLHWMIA